MIYARNVLFDQFATLPGVGNIAQGGYVDPALRIWADLDKMDRLNLTSDDVLQAIQDGHLETPAGIIRTTRQEYNVRLMGEATSPEEFGKISINSRAGLGPNFRHVQMKQIGDGRGRTRGRLQDRLLQQALHRSALGILKQHGSNAVEVANEVRKKLKEIQPTIPKGWHVDVRSDNTRFIKQSVDELLFTLVLSALLTVDRLLPLPGFAHFDVQHSDGPSRPRSSARSPHFSFFNFTLNTFTLLGFRSRSGSSSTTRS